MTIHIPTPQLAPAPDFRYVGLDLGQPSSLRAWAGLLGAGAVVGGAGFHGAAGAVLGVGVAASAGVLARLVEGAGTAGEAAAGLAIVPWGVLIETRERTRIVHWPGVLRVDVDAIHGTNGGTPTTRYSQVTIETIEERFVGRAFGALPLERLAAYLDAYAREASHRIALDLDGAKSGEGPSEPDAELLLAAARAYVESGSAADRLELPAGSYREPGRRTASMGGVSTLGCVLRDRTVREVDPRPFAAVLAVELRATDVADDLVPLVQSPLPLLAAVAKIAAAKLGISKTTVGSLDEVEPFLLSRDAEALAAWQAA